MKPDSPNTKKSTKEATFIEDAELSLNPNKDYPMQPLQLVGRKRYV